MVYSLAQRYRRVGIILMSLHSVRFVAEYANHKYRYDILENDVLIRLASSNICNSHVDISKLAILPDIARIETR
jgi:hypothetical protein